MTIKPGLVPETHDDSFAFAMTCAFLSHWKPLKHPRQPLYGLKHWVERWARKRGIAVYVPEHVAEAAARQLGFPTTPGGLIAISAKARILPC